MTCQCTSFPRGQVSQAVERKHSLMPGQLPRHGDGDFSQPIQTKYFPII